MNLVSITLVLAAFLSCPCSVEAQVTGVIPGLKGLSESKVESFDVSREMTIVAAKLQKAKAAGVGVKTYQVMYEQAETSIKAGEPLAQTRTILDSISRALAAQESASESLKAKLKISTGVGQTFKPCGSTSTAQVKLDFVKATRDNIDYGSYMAEVQRRIKSAWHPMKSGKTTKAVILFQVFADGHIADCRFTTHSGSADFDLACFMALQNAAPFLPLPRGSESPVNVDFDFDYNVFNGGGSTGK